MIIKYERNLIVQDDAKITSIDKTPTGRTYLTIVRIDNRLIASNLNDCQLASTSIDRAPLKTTVSNAKEDAKVGTSNDGPK